MEEGVGVYHMHCALNALDVLRRIESKTDCRRREGGSSLSTLGPLRQPVGSREGVGVYTGSLGAVTAYGWGGRGWCARDCVGCTGYKGYTMTN